MQLNGAQILIEVLKEEGVDTIFGYPGGAVIDIYDEMARSDISHVLVRHEQGAVHAADGYARASGSVGVCLHIAAFNQIFRGYGIPTYNADGYPGSKRMDFQTGYEKAMRVLITGLSGGSSRPLHGGVYGELSHHPVQAIMDDDLAGMVGRFLEGVTVNHETLAVDLINEVGPIPGHFLNKQHTRDWWKREQFIPVAADRLTYPEWINSGKKSCLDYARERMEQILSTHKPLPLTEGEEEELERVLEEARRYYKEKGLISEEEMSAYRNSMKSPNYPFE